MSAPPVIKLIAENLTDEARALAPAEGRRRPVEVDAAGLRIWLDNYAALPALDTEDAEARLYLTVPGRRLVVRRAGGRLGAEEGDTFVAATVEEIVTQLLAVSWSTGAGKEEPAPEVLLPLPPRARARGQGWLLTGLIAICAAVWWWSFLPENPEGVEWIGDAERGAILTRAAGNYTSDDERLKLDASAQLTAMNVAGEETLRTTVRVGRRAGAVLLVTESGVLLEIMPDGHLRLDTSDYRRLPAGG